AAWTPTHCRVPWSSTWAWPTTSWPRSSRGSTTASVPDRPSAADSSTSVRPSNHCSPRACVPRKERTDMDFSFDSRTEALVAELNDFMATHVLPAEPVFDAQLADLEDRFAWTRTPVV